MSTTTVIAPVNPDFKGRPASGNAGQVTTPVVTVDGMMGRVRVSYVNRKDGDFYLVCAEKMDITRAGEIEYIAIETSLVTYRGDKSYPCHDPHYCESMDSDEFIMTPVDQGEGHKCAILHAHHLSLKHGFITQEEVRATKKLMKANDRRKIEQQRAVKVAMIGKARALREDARVIRAKAEGEIADDIRAMRARYTELYGSKKAALAPEPVTEVAKTRKPRGKK